MKIKFEKDTKKHTYFEDLETGVAFTYNNILYIKTNKEQSNEYNAINLYENKVDFIKPDALVHIKEYEIDFKKTKRFENLKPGDTFENIDMVDNDRYMKLKPTKDFNFNALNLNHFTAIKISDYVEVYPRDTQIKVKSEHTCNDSCDCCNEDDSKKGFENNPNFIKKTFNNAEEFLDFVMHEILDKKD